jgi:hypothetical protein
MTAAKEVTGQIAVDTHELEVVGVPSVFQYRVENVRPFSHVSAAHPSPELGSI